MRDNFDSRETSGFASSRLGWPCVGRVMTADALVKKDCIDFQLRQLKVSANANILRRSKECAKEGVDGLAGSKHAYQGNEKSKTAR